MFRTSILLYCAVACLITWSAKFFLAAVEIGRIPDNIPRGWIQLIAQFGPSLSGLVFIFWEKGSNGIINVFRNFTGIKVHYKWFVFALFFELVSFILIVFSLSVMGYKDTTFITDEAINSLIMFFANTVTLTLLTGLGEEIGWRGFLLPKLQSSLPVINAAVILALINSLWHLRTDFLSLLMQGDYHGFISGYLPDMILRIMISIPVVIIIMYLFNNTGGSLFIMILYHGSANASWEWVKQVTGVADPSYILPVWAVFLWLTMLYFIPALKRQSLEKRLITRL